MRACVRACAHVCVCVCVCVCLRLYPSLCLYVCFTTFVRTRMFINIFYGIEFYASINVLRVLLLFRFAFFVSLVIFV